MGRSRTSTSTTSTWSAHQNRSAEAARVKVAVTSWPAAEQRRHQSAADIATGAHDDDSHDGSQGSVVATGGTHDGSNLPRRFDAAGPRRRPDATRVRDGS